jgi:hypothetical protein
MIFARIFRPQFRLAAKVCVALIAVCSAARLLPAQALKATDYQVKAAYLTNLGRFVEQWSTRAKPSPDESFDLCVLGEDPFGSVLDVAVKDEKIGGARLAAKRIAKAQDAAGCRVLFISSSEEKQMANIVSALGNEPVLTVGDFPGFVRHGGMIQFVIENNRVKVGEINNASVQRAGLKLSSELLKLARVVKDTP